MPHSAWSGSAKCATEAALDEPEHALLCVASCLHSLAILLSCLLTVLRAALPSHDPELTCICRENTVQNSLALIQGYRGILFALSRGQGVETSDKKTTVAIANKMFVCYSTDFMP